MTLHAEPTNKYPDAEGGMNFPFPESQYTGPPDSFLLTTHKKQSS